MSAGGSRRAISAVNASCGRDARGVSRSSDVTDQTETGSNRGRALAAGVMPGARDSRAGASNAGVWERGLSRSTRKRGGKAARQSQCRSCINEWCRVQNDDERADEHFPCVHDVSAWCRGRKDLPRRLLLGRKTAMWSKEDRRKTAVLWLRNDDPPARCTCRWIDGFRPQPLCERGCY